MSVDAVDERILAELERDSRASFRKLAARLGLAPATVIARTRRLEREGVITGFGARLDFQKLGFDYMGVTEITIRKGALLEVQRKIAQLQGVVSVFDVTGQSDSIVFSRCRSRSEFSALLKKILSLENVERTNTHVVLNVVKEGGVVAPRHY